MTFIVLLWPQVILDESLLVSWKIMNFFYINKSMVPHKHIKEIRSMIHSRLFAIYLFFGKFFCIENIYIEIFLNEKKKLNWKNIYIKKNLHWKKVKSKKYLQKIFSCIKNIFSLKKCLHWKNWLHWKIVYIERLFHIQKCCI
jgi:hypothetical protein